MRTDSNGNALPRGVMYDPARMRYRVRLYRYHRVIWLSYTRNRDEAIADFELAKQKQDNVRQHSGTIRGVVSLVNALQHDFI